MTITRKMYRMGLGSDCETREKGGERTYKRMEGRERLSRWRGIGIERR